MDGIARAAGIRDVTFIGCLGLVISFIGGTIGFGIFFLLHTIGIIP